MTVGRVGIGSTIRGTASRCLEEVGNVSSASVEVFAVFLLLDLFASWLSGS